MANKISSVFVAEEYWGPSTLILYASKNADLEKSNMACVSSSKSALKSRENAVTYVTRVLFRHLEHKFDCKGERDTPENGREKCIFLLLFFSFVVKSLFSVWGDVRNVLDVIFLLLWNFQFVKFFLFAVVWVFERKNSIEVDNFISKTPKYLMERLSSIFVRLFIDWIDSDIIK